MPGVLVALGLLLFLFAPLVAVAFRAGHWPALSVSDWAAVRFTLWQAFLSASVSCLLAIPVARALAARRFVGRDALIVLLGAPFMLPVIVAVMGLLAIFGRNGLISDALSMFGFPPISIYGLHGVVIAHVFLNLPLAVRLLLAGWASVPGEAFRLGATLDFGRREILKVVERPILLRVLPGAFLVIFVICLSSFAVALLLGGGPKATTIELAIYQAFRFEFDLGRASSLAMIQVAVCSLGALLVAIVGNPVRGVDVGLDVIHQRWDGGRRVTKLFDGFWILVAAGFLMLPLSAIVMRGFGGLDQLPPAIIGAGIRSLIVAVGAAFLATLLGLSISISVARLGGHRKTASLVEATGYLSVALSPLVLGTGMFILIFPFMDPTRLVLGVTALVNALMALPFVLRSLVPAARRAEDAFGHLADSLSMSGITRWRLLYLPRMRREIGFGAGLAAALSMGDLGVVTLFASSDAPTLPMMVYRLMGSYRMEAAAGTALILVALTLAIFWICDWSGRRRA